MVGLMEEFKRNYERIENDIVKITSGDFPAEMEKHNKAPQSGHHWIFEIRTRLSWEHKPRFLPLHHTIQSRTPSNSTTFRKIKGVLK